jgi:signal transduction histidine kinase
LEEINQHISTVTLAAFVFLFFIVFFLSFLFLYFRKFYRLQADKKQLEVQFQKEVAAAAIEIQEAFLSRLSLDIHDNVNQTLSLAKIQISGLLLTNQNDKKLIAEAKSNISDAINTLRNMAKSMNGDTVIQIGFRHAIKELINSINNSDILHIKLVEVGAPFNLHADKSLLVFRMVQEAIQNVLKHANATLVIIRLTNDHDYCSIEIQDNGIGFDTSAEIKEGIGINSLYKRVALLGGKLSIKSSPQKGTTVNIQL